MHPRQESIWLKLKIFSFHLWNVLTWISRERLFITVQGNGCDCWSLRHSVTAWSDNKVRELIAVKVRHNSLLNITVVAFKVIPLGRYTPMPAPSPPMKTTLELGLWSDLQSSRRNYS
jgi:hypothetical protein